MKKISQIVNIPAAPVEVYDALMDEKKHAEFIGAGAKIENKVSGRFEVWDGYATGKNLELVKGKKIVQSWRASDWPKDAESQVTFELTAGGEGTKIEFTQKNTPDEFAADVKQGWIDYYWKPLKNYFRK